MSQAFITKNRAILDPNGTGEVDLSGGFHDAGDFIKFGITTGFMASTLAWSLYEYPDSFRVTGLEDEALNLLRLGRRLLHALDLPRRWRQPGGVCPPGQRPKRSHLRLDAPELAPHRLLPRKGYFATAETPAADVTASAAAALP